MGDKFAYVCCGISLLMCVLVSVMIIIIVGAGTIEPIEYGIVKGKLTQQIDEEAGVYKGGWYFIGWTNNFVIFPAHQVNMDFTTYRGAKYKPLKVIDGGGQAITVSFSL